MPEALIPEFTGIGKDQYDAVNEKLGIDMSSGRGNWPRGLLMHAAGTADDETFVVSEVWASRADHDAFMNDRLGAALAAGGVTSPPEVTWVPLLAYHTPGS